MFRLRNDRLVARRLRLCASRTGIPWLAPEVADPSGDRAGELSGNDAEAHDGTKRDQGLCECGVRVEGVSYQVRWVSFEL